MASESELNESVFIHSVDTAKPFGEAVVSVLKAVEKKGWSVFGVIDIGERLAAKGFARGPMKVVEICSGKHANAFLTANSLVSVCMPCRISIFQKGGKTTFAFMRPDAMAKFFHGVGQEDADAAERDLVEIVSDSK